MTLATVDIIRRTGASGTPTDTAVTSGTTRWKTADSPVVDANNPLPIPLAGTTYSYWLSLRLNVTANPDGHTINAVKFYAATNSVPGGVVISGQNATSYVQATGTPGVTGTQLTTGNHAGLSGAPVDVFTFTSSAPKSLGAGSTTGTGLVGDYMVMQVAADTTAVPQSPAPANTFRFRYDEA